MACLTHVCPRFGGNGMGAGFTNPEGADCHAVPVGEFCPPRLPEGGAGGSFAGPPGRPGGGGGWWEGAGPGRGGGGRGGGGGERAEGQGSRASVPDGRTEPHRDVRSQDGGPG